MSGAERLRNILAWGREIKKVGNHRNKLTTSFNDAVGKRRSERQFAFYRNVVRHVRMAI